MIISQNVLDDRYFKKENVFLSTFSLDLNISPAELPLT